MSETGTAAAGAMSNAEWAGAGNINSAANYAAEGEGQCGGAGEALSAAEAAYFASRGEAALPAETGAAADEGGEGAEQENSGRAAKTAPRAELRAMQVKARQWQQDLAPYAATAAAAAGAQQPFEAQQGEGQPQTLEPQGPQTPPDPREDFLGFARWQSAEISRLNQQLAAREKQAEEQSRAAAAEEALMREWDSSVAALRGQHDDADAALDYLEQARLSQLQALAAADGRFADAQFCRRQIFSELRDIIIGTYQQGLSPAEAVYNMARAYGYGRDETARLGKIAEASQAARSLTAGAGGEAGDPYLLETVASLSEAEFAKWYEKNRGSFRAMFGG